jgi:hypothetical protein
MPFAQGIKSEPVSVEMSGSLISVILTQGAINIWFGRNLDKALIAKVLLIISKVDSSTEHEREVICDFQKISEFESNGYILTSYARRNDKYRAIFVVPFANPRALDKFIESISEEVEREGVRFTLYWNGGKVRMNTIRDELSRLGCFSLMDVTYKEEQSGDQIA